MERYLVVTLPRRLLLIFQRKPWRPVDATDLHFFSRQSVPGLRAKLQLLDYCKTCYAILPPILHSLCRSVEAELTQVNGFCFEVVSLNEDTCTNLALKFIVLALNQAVSYRTKFLF